MSVIASHRLASAPPPPAVVVPAQIISPGYWRSVGRRLVRDRVAMLCAAVLVLLVLAAIFAPWVAPADPFKTSMLKRLLPVGTAGHWLGTDELGRDLLSRLIYGGRLSLTMGIVPVTAAFLIGTSIGVAAGFMGGKVNMAVMRTLDVFYAFPSVLLAVAISGAMGPGLSNSLLALTIVFIPQIARVAESVTTQVAKLEYIDAARMSGATSLTIIRLQVLGNVLGPVFVYATGLISVCMILASGLSFLGLGVRPPEAEWGLMLNTLRAAIFNNPVVAALPGAMIFITSICFNLLADGIRSAMDLKR
jgi:peptide/nickel transport system permease protein